MAESAVKGAIYVNGFPGPAMLNRHNNLLLPQSERLKVGDAVVDIPRRVVVLPDGSTSRLTLKAQQVLLMLVNRRLHVVSREAILEWVWPDTLPTNDIVTQAVTQLRRALADDAAAPRFVETIAKTGYRLIAPIEWLPDGDVGGQVEPSGDTAPDERDDSRNRAGVYAIAATAGAALIVVLGIFVSAKYKDGSATLGEGADDQDAPKIAVRNLTSGPVQEWAPRLSPDGSMVVYVARDPEVGGGHARIKSQASTLTAARQLTKPGVDESDVMPAWSPDGRHIAFKRYARDESCRVMVVPASGGIERSIADCGDSGYFDWTADGSGLIASANVSSPDSGPSVLRILDIASGQWRDLHYERAPNDVDLEPRYSPDGKWIGFRRNFSLTDIWKVPAGGGKPVRLTHLEGDIRGWDWTPDSKAIVFSFNQGWRVGLHRLDLAKGRVEWLGIEGAMMPDVAEHVASVVFTLDKTTTSIYRYRIASSDGNQGAAREQLFPSSGSDMLPVVSSDGGTLAYLSDRSGDLQLWIGEVGRLETLRPIENLLPMPRHSPVWSPDGSHLLIVGLGEDRPWLYEVDVASARATRMDIGTATPVYAAYLPGGERLVGVDEGGGALQLRRYRAADGGWKPVGRLQGVSAVRVDETSGQIYFTRAGTPGLWRTDASLADIEQVSDSQPNLLAYKSWLIRDGTVWIVGTRKGCNHWFRPLAGADVPSRGLCLGEEASAPVIPSISRDGAWVYVWGETETNMDIGWAELPPMGAASAAAGLNARK